jgi:hypothetical protein
MPRQDIAAQAPLGSYPTLPIAANGADVVWTLTTDQTDRSTALYNAKTLVLARNSDTVVHTVTFTSVPDSLNRPGHITAYALDPGDVGMFGPFQASGWAIAGQLEIDVSSALVLLAALRLP